MQHSSMLIYAAGVTLIGDSHAIYYTSETLPHYIQPSSDAMLKLFISDLRQL